MTIVIIIMTIIIIVIIIIITIITIIITTIIIIIIIIIVVIIIITIIAIYNNNTQKSIVPHGRKKGQGLRQGVEQVLFSDWVLDVHEVQTSDYWVFKAFHLEIMNREIMNNRL